ncbi:MAG: 50S ribosomal protein L13 [Nanoarchaeota archaeon]|nr:50S ribosomal protein L13 [Nanoarchaeota archaeon]
MIINAENLIVGRLSTYAAKKALLGEKVDIVNCEKAVITGKKQEIIKHYKQKVDRGTPFKGPFIPRRPDMFVRRIIRGMLPYKKERGKKAFKNIMCYISIPDTFKNEKLETIKKADMGKLTNLKYIQVQDLVKQLGT